MEWKDNAPYVLCLTHDVDRIKKQWYHYLFYGIRHPLIQLKTLWFKITEHDPYWNFREVTKLEESYGVRSTFFFLNEAHKELSADFMGRYDIQSSKVQNIIRELDSRGFEVGLHGSYFSFNDEKTLRKEKKKLEQILGHEIVSTRQHHLRLDENCTWMIQKKIGIKYDSTRGYTKKVDTEQPFRTREGVLEIPITLMDTVDLTEEIFQECCSVADGGGIIMLNFHQCHFNRIEYPNNVNMYSKFLAKARNDGAWIARVKELGEWLDERT